VRVLDMYPMIQSEGHQYGAVQFMVRAAGCAVECPIRSVCDEEGALDFRAGKDYSPEEIVNAARVIGPHGWIHISGGEPCNQPRELIELQQVAHRLHHKVHLQTSGTIKVPIKWDWLTVSPKCSEPELKQRFGQELKLIHTPDVGLNDLAAFYYKTKFSDYYLQPLWDGGECNAQETFDLVMYANRCGMQWKMSVQWHKWLGFK
jgi:organic radical activating enzyme